jgi:hypothetical protein
MGGGFERQDGIGTDKAKAFTTASITATVHAMDSHFDDRKSIELMFARIAAANLC